MSRELLCSSGFQLELSTAPIREGLPEGRHRRGNRRTSGIEKGSLVRSGRSIEVYDYEKGQYLDVDVEDITRRGNGVEVEVYDSGTGEYRTYEFDD